MWIVHIMVLVVVMVQALPSLALPPHHSPCPLTEVEHRRLAYELEVMLTDHLKLWNHITNTSKEQEQKEERIRYETQKEKLNKIIKGSEHNSAKSFYIKPRKIIKREEQIKNKKEEEKTAKVIMNNIVSIETRFNNIITTHIKLNGTPKTTEILPSKYGGHHEEGDIMAKKGEQSTDRRARYVRPAEGQEEKREILHSDKNIRPVREERKYEKRGTQSNDENMSRSGEKTDERRGKLQTEKRAKGIARETQKKGMGETPLIGEEERKELRNIVKREALGIKRRRERAASPAIIYMPGRGNEKVRECALIHGLLGGFNTFNFLSFATGLVTLILNVNNNINNNNDNNNVNANNDINNNNVNANLNTQNANQVVVFPPGRRRRSVADLLMTAADTQEEGGSDGLQRGMNRMHGLCGGARRIVQEMKALLKVSSEHEGKRNFMEH
ncbi:myb-like protein W [Portunus trituberculatus]|uniref:myb-like protein W n=1 Tax=Portunus trituberculatus TaxID=210409 RepID=UPI001E1CCFF4|nr:myb-like protein W [Portunus trituberculatus]XP_045129325.1 myb-like protein W [Portunus trituberculatus]